MCASMVHVRSLLVACCSVVLAGTASPDARATETDQFTLPPKQLDDLGPDLGGMVLEILHNELALLNAQIIERARDRPEVASEPVDERELLRHIYEQTGVGLPEPTLERAIRYGDFTGRNVRFKPSLSDSIYAGAMTPVPFAHLLTDCPTIRLYGIDLGTDKIGHIFQQGFEYLTRYADARAEGANEQVAVAKAVKFGVMTESTYLGIALTGVYSNGDLAGNFAGLKFYLNVFHEVRIGDHVLAPMIRRDGSRWVMNPDRDNSDFLKPLISEHLNEAFNPSLYTWSVERIRSNLRKVCASWFSYVPDFNETSYRAHLDRVRNWFGESYGGDLPDDKAVTLLECFGPRR